MPIGLRYAARSHVGMVRSENQDSGYAGPHLLAMADGMGGHAGGDIASSVVISNLVGLDDEAHGAAESSDELLAAIRRANDELAARVRAQPELDGMGTTLIAILRSRRNLVIASIGDSRAYLARGGTVTQITKDHSYVQTLVDSGKITPDEAAVHPQRSLVTRVLTGREDDEPDIAAREAEIGDRYLIASDGLSDYVAASTIEELLVSGRGPDAVADELVALALRAGAPDNVTVVIGDVIDVTKEQPSTVPQIVGAAAVEQHGTKPIPVTPAEKAAALSASTERRVLASDLVMLAEEKPTTRGRRLLRALVGLLLLLAIAGGAYAAYAWTQTRYYVGEYRGTVAIFRGVDQALGPVHLSTRQVVTDIKTTDLPAFYRQRILDTVSRPDEQSARQLVDELRIQATLCIENRAAGRSCDDATSPTTPGTGPTGATTGTRT